MQRMQWYAPALALAVMLTAATAEAQVATAEHRVLTLAGARAVGGAAAAEAARLNAPGGAIAVVDDGGHVLYLERLDNTFPAAADIAIAKARTAVLFRRPTKVLEDAIVGGRTTLLNVADAPLQGGVPLVVDGVVVGAVGVSGAASADQDEAIARAAAQSAGAPAAMASVGWLDSAAVAAAFARGVPLLETGAYKIHASRRESAGQVEVHLRDTDIIYVLAGSATFVTGGTVNGGRTTAPDEIRGRSVDGGQSRTLRPGDVVVVPNGTAHWFQQVQGPLLYYVVKVPAAPAMMPAAMGAAR